MVCVTTVNCGATTAYRSSTKNERSSVAERYHSFTQEVSV
jgi:hypothetical protein